MRLVRNVVSHFDALSRLKKRLIAALRTYKATPRLPWQITERELPHLILGKTPLPRTVFLDPINACNLRCPLCVTGAQIASYKATRMSYRCFQRIVDGMPHVKELLLFNWGEPFLNPDIFDMVEYASAKGIKTTIDTNFSIERDEEFFRNIVECGLDTLRLSIDGTTQESYGKYRIRGDLDLVLSNLDTLLRVRRTLGAEAPFIVWKFIVHRHNEHELETARRMARERGIAFITSEMGLGDDLPDARFAGSLEERRREWLPRSDEIKRGYYIGEYKYPLIDRRCTYLFSLPVIAPDGKVFPCCYTSDERNVFGDLNESSFEEIWNNEKFVSARNLFLQSVARKDAAGVVCDQCDIFRKRHRRTNAGPAGSGPGAPGPQRPENPGARQPRGGERRLPVVP